MSFWAKSTGQNAEATMEQEGAESGKLVRIPDNTMCQAVVVDVELAKVRDEDFVEGVYEYEGYRITWNIIEDGEYNGVNVRQSLRVMSNVNNKRDQALDVMAFMDLHMNGGKFSKLDEAPEVQDLLDAFGNQPMLVKIRAMTSTSQTDGSEQYNQWVAGVYRKRPDSHPAHATAADAVKHAVGKVQQQTQQKSGPAAGPKPTGPAAGPKAGPTVNKPAGETAAEKRERLAREAEELRQQEAQEEADRQATQQQATAIDEEMEGAQTTDDEPLDY